MKSCSSAAVRHRHAARGAEPGPRGRGRGHRRAQGAPGSCKIFAVDAPGRDDTAAEAIAEGDTARTPPSRASLPRGRRQTCLVGTNSRKNRRAAGGPLAALRQMRALRNRWLRRSAETWQIAGEGSNESSFMPKAIAIVPTEMPALLLRAKREHDGDLSQGDLIAGGLATAPGGALPGAVAPRGAPGRARCGTPAPVPQENAVERGMAPPSLPWQEH